MLLNFAVQFLLLILSLYKLRHFAFVRFGLVESLVCVRVYCISYLCWYSYFNLQALIKDINNSVNIFNDTLLRVPY